MTKIEDTNTKSFNDTKIEDTGTKSFNDYDSGNRRKELQ